MILRLVLAAIVCAALLPVLGGCATEKDRLYVSEWKQEKTFPVKVHRDFEYHGEHWERCVWVEPEEQQ